LANNCGNEEGTEDDWAVMTIFMFNCPCKDDLDACSTGCISKVSNTKEKDKGEMGSSLLLLGSFL
jgi:hypothetical protein